MLNLQRKWVNRYLYMAVIFVVAGIAGLGIVYTVTTELALKNAQQDLSSSLDNVQKSVSGYE